jgi:ESX secretion-associated protein EspG
VRSGDHKTDHAEEPGVRTDITVNVEGFWMLQALLNIQFTAPELRCLPYAPNTVWPADHPGLTVLAEAGIIVDGVVREDIAERMWVLAAPDLNVVAVLSAGPIQLPAHQIAEAASAYDIPPNEFRILLARRGERWVSAVRVGAEITVDDVAVDGAGSIAAIVTAAIDSIHPADPAPVRAANVPLDVFASVTQHWKDTGFRASCQTALRTMGLSADTAAALEAAFADPAAEAALYARQYRDEQTLHSQSMLTLKDGAAGRIALYPLAPVTGFGPDWMTICPGTPQAIEAGVQTVLDTLPTGPGNRRLGS